MDVLNGSEMGIADVQLNNGCHKRGVQCHMMVLEVHETGMEGPCNQVSVQKKPIFWVVKTTSTWPPERSVFGHFM